jgi:hypothetical protein
MVDLTIIGAAAILRAREKHDMYNRTFDLSNDAVASQLVKLLVMVVIVNLSTITRLNITYCNIGGCGKIGTHREGQEDQQCRDMWESDRG